MLSRPTFCGEWLKGHFSAVIRDYGRYSIMKDNSRRVSRSVWRELSRVRPGLLPLVAFTALLGVMNILLVNQKIVLYLFYLPVIMAAWTLRKRHAVSVALLAAVLVAAFAFFLPQSLPDPESLSLLWAELSIWGGILVVTAYMVSTLRAWTEEAMRSLERAYSGVLAILSKFIETIDDILLLTAPGEGECDIVKRAVHVIGTGQRFACHP